MAIFTGLRPFPRFPSGRYTVSNPLRRESALRLLTANMPEGLRGVVITGLRLPFPFTGEQTPLAIQSANRRRPSDAFLREAPAVALDWLVVTELGATRRVVEAPLSSVSRVTRSTLLVAQGAELRRLYLALAAKLGDAAALAVFQRALAARK